MRNVYAVINQQLIEKKKRMDGHGAKGEYYGGKIEIPVCKTCIHHVPSNYETLIPISIFIFVASLFFYAFIGFELNAGSIILFALGLPAIIFVIRKVFKVGKWKKIGHFPNYHINPLPNNFVFTTNNLDLALKIIKLNEFSEIEIEKNDLLNEELNKRLTTGR